MIALGLWLPEKRVHLARGLLQKEEEAQLLSAPLVLRPIRLGRRGWEKTEKGLFLGWPSVTGLWAFGYQSSVGLGEPGPSRPIFWNESQVPRTEAGVDLTDHRGLQRPGPHKAGLRACAHLVCAPSQVMEPT